MLQTLKRLHWYSGSIQMRLRLGVFIMTQYIPPTRGHYELGEYETMIKQSRFKGYVTEE